MQHLSRTGSKVTSGGRGGEGERGGGGGGGVLPGRGELVGGGGRRPGVVVGVDAAVAGVGERLKGERDAFVRHGALAGGGGM
ncbi:hypothetical protein DM086_30205 [Klebsiella pneumoniae]|nr:hypothetical protein DM086_30205 [Klebsiella pneumoniae]